MISIPACTRLAFCETVINIFTNDSEPKDISEFCYFNSRVLNILVNLLGKWLS